MYHSFVYPDETGKNELGVRLRHVRMVNGEIFFSEPVRSCDVSLCVYGISQKTWREIRQFLAPEFSKARRLSEKAQAFAVSSTPEAESRSSDITLFTLADSLKYLMPREQNGNLDS